MTTYEANPEKVAQWIDELRSNSWKQGQKYLKTAKGDAPPRHCCLGVLCEISDVPEDSPDSLTHWRSDGLELRSVFAGSTSVEPAPVLKWLADYEGDAADLDDYRVVLKENYSSGEMPSSRLLEELNDSGMSFHEIANAIETHGVQIEHGH